MARLDGESRHALVLNALEALARMTHRGAIAADGRTGDGCGLLVAQPEAFLRAVAAEQGIEPAPVFAAGMIFLDPDPGTAANERRALEEALGAAGVAVAGWRAVPVDASVCGEEAAAVIDSAFQIAQDNSETLSEYIDN